MGHGGSKTASDVVVAYITPKFNRKCHNNLKKKRKERGERRRE
jgi:hypothetical protein